MLDIEKVNGGQIDYRQTYILETKLERRDYLDWESKLFHCTKRDSLKVGFIKR
jgi:hypothetical protein